MTADASVLESPAIDQLIQAMSARTETAYRLGRGCLSGGGMAFPSHLVSKLKGDLARCAKADEAFIAAWNQAQWDAANEKRPDIKGLMRAWEKWILALGVLEDTISRFKAILDALLHVTAAQYFGYLATFNDRIKPRFKKLAEKLKKAQSALKAARKEADDVEAERLIGATLAATGTLLGLASGGAAIAVGGFVASVVVDAYYSQNKWSGEANMKTVNAEIIDSLGYTTVKGVGVVGAINSLMAYQDGTKSLGKARKALQRAAKALLDVKKEIKDLDKLCKDMQPLFKASGMQFQKSLKAAKNRIAFASSDKLRNGLLRELAKVDAK